jgi:hypothetical protein
MQAGAAHAHGRASARPDFGPKCASVRSSRPAAEILAAIDPVCAIEQHSEFGRERYALLFLPGQYRVDMPVGFYTQVLGLGASPDDVVILGKQGAISNLIDDQGGSTSIQPRITPKVAEFP